MTDEGDPRRLALLSQKYDRAAQVRGAVEELGAVIVREAHRLLTLKCQYLCQAAKLPRGAEASMDQHVDGLPGIQMKTVIRVVRARRQAGNRERDVGSREVAGVNRPCQFRRFARCAFSAQQKYGGDDDC